MTQAVRLLSREFPGGDEGIVAKRALFDDELFPTCFRGDPPNLAVLVDVILGEHQLESFERALPTSEQQARKMWTTCFDAALQLTTKLLNDDFGSASETVLLALLGTIPTHDLPFDLEEERGIGLLRPT